MNSVSLAETIQSVAINGLQRWRSDDYLHETARTRSGYNLSEIVLGVTSSRGGTGSGKRVNVSDSLNWTTCTVTVVTTTICQEADWTLQR